MAGAAVGPFVGLDLAPLGRALPALGDAPMRLLSAVALDPSIRRVLWQGQPGQVIEIHIAPGKNHSYPQTFDCHRPFKHCGHRHRR